MKTNVKITEKETRKTVKYQQNEVFSKLKKIDKYF